MSTRALLTFVGVYALAALAARPWMGHWGSTADERALPLPGDELVADASEQTHAITIEGAHDDVWPWLVQMGQGRAGFYSHDRLERLIGAAIKNANEIHPEWQKLGIDDLIRTYRPLPRFEPLGWFDVAVVDPARTLVVHGAEHNGAINSSWALVLDRDSRGRTRLLSRWRFRCRGPADALFWFVFDPAHFIMETGVLRGIKSRVKKQGRATYASEHWTAHGRLARTPFRRRSRVTSPTAATSAVFACRRPPPSAGSSRTARSSTSAGASRRSPPPDPIAQRRHVSLRVIRSEVQWHPR